MVIYKGNALGHTDRKIQCILHAYIQTCNIANFNFFNADSLRTVFKIFDYIRYYLI